MIDISFGLVVFYWLMSNRKFARNLWSELLHCPTQEHNYVILSSRRRQLQSMHSSSLHIAANICWCMIHTTYNANVVFACVHFFRIFVDWVDLHICMKSILVCVSLSIVELCMRNSLLKKIIITKLIVRKAQA